MGITLTGYFNGSSGIKELFKRLTVWKVNPLFYIFVLLFTAATFYIPLWICNIPGSNYTIYVPTSYINLLTFFETILIGGPLGEELGWRGFALPKLQSKLNPIYSSIILGIFWSCWHLPLFFIYGTGQYGIPFILFIASTTSLSILFTWVYNRTQGSLIFPILFHGAHNFTSGLIYYQPINYYMREFNRYTVISIMLQIIIILFVIIDMIRKSSNHSNSIVCNNN